MEAIGERNDGCWGLDLVPELPPNIPFHVVTNMRINLRLWKLYGLVFLDYHQVCDIGNMEMMAEVELSWLEAPWG